MGWRVEIGSCSRIVDNRFSYARPGYSIVYSVLSNYNFDIVRLSAIKYDNVKTGIYWGAGGNERWAT